METEDLIDGKLNALANLLARSLLMHEVVTHSH